MDKQVIDRRVLELWDEFRHVHFDRRVFMERLAAVVGGAGAATAAAELLYPDDSRAVTVPESDPRLHAEAVSYPGASGQVKGYLAVPARRGRHGGVIVVHQNRGLNGHIQDIARRLAVAGYVALAPDFLSQKGGTPPDQDAAIRMFSGLDVNLVNGDARAGFAWLRARPECNGKVGAIGFCWGGDEIGRLAVSEPLLRAAAVFYGVPPDASLVPKIKAELLLNYADPTIDTRIGGKVPAFEAALKADHKTFALYYYKGAGHAFNDDTSPAYDKAAATLAWGRALALFRRKLT